MQNLKKIIEEGIVYEDVFIKMYTKFLLDEHVLELFEDKQRAKMLMQTLYDDSVKHKKMLNKIIENI